MGITAPDAIVYPDNGTAFSPLETHFANLAESTQTAINNVRGSTAPPVANAAARNTLFPNPVPGNRVYRIDLGYEEAYYALYDVSANPGGRTPAGWYQVSADTGWVNLVLVQGAVTHGGLTPQIRKKDGVVFFRGRVTQPSLLIADNLPSDMRPTQDLRFVAAFGDTGSGSGPLIVTASGTLYTATGNTVNLPTASYPVG